MSTKKREKGVKYNLVYRSSRDEGHAGENAPSSMVLMPALSGNAQRRKKTGSAGGGADASSHNTFAESISTHKDHINALGLPNDGYDYSQHLREMGQGKFIGADGKERKLPEAYLQPRNTSGSGFDIPDELMPSTGELDRRLEAVTLDERTMDPDLLAALWGDLDENGEAFEELNDDFCLEAMQEPAEVEFDWEAHMAMLLARSEKLSGVGTSRVKPRGWEGQKGAVARMAQNHAIAAGDEEEECDSDDSGWVPDVIEEEDGEEERGSMEEFFRQKAMLDVGKSRRLTALGLANAQVAGAGGVGGGRVRSDSNNAEEETNTQISEDRRTSASKMSVYSKGGTRYSSQGGGRFKARSATRIIAEEKKRQEKLFEDTLAEYDDENIGDLEHLYYEEYDDEGDSDEGDEEGEDGEKSGVALNQEEQEQRELEKAARKSSRAIAFAQRSITGTIGLEELEQNPELDAMLDEFLESQKDEERVFGIHTVPGAREIHALEAYVDPVPFLGVKEAVAELERRQKESEEELRAAMATSRLLSMHDISTLNTRAFEKENHDELVDCQAYLAEEREVDDWDCETVLSTYSTLDNHPKLLKEPTNSKFRTHKSRFALKQERELAESEEVGTVEGGREALTKAAYSAPRSIGGVGRPEKVLPSRIVLAGKLLLPEGYGGDNKNRLRREGGTDDDQSVATISSRFTVNSSATGKFSVGSATSGGGTSVRLRMPQGASSAATSRTHARTEQRQGLTTLIEEQASKAKTEEGEEDASGDEDQDSDEGTSYTAWTKASRKAESSEEKKARKDAAKNDQRIKRQNKKTMRSIYQEEKGKVIRAEGNKQKTDHVSVFKY